MLLSVVKFDGELIDDRQAFEMVDVDDGFDVKFEIEIGVGEIVVRVEDGAENGSVFGRFGIGGVIRQGVEFGIGGDKAFVGQLADDDGKFQSDGQLQKSFVRFDKTTIQQRRIVVK